MYLVVFRNRKRPGYDAQAYARDAAAMERLARAQAGFISFKSYTADDGEVVALSEWESREAALGWGRHPDHSRVQSRGRQLYYSDYTLFACDDPRITRFPGDTGP